MVVEAYVDLRIQTDAAAELAQVGPPFFCGRNWGGFDIRLQGHDLRHAIFTHVLHDYMSTYLQVKDKGLQGMNPWEEADANVLGFRWDFHEGHSWDRRFCV